VTWFRHTFTVPDAAAFDGLQIDLQRDDGAIVWLNGSELLRDNLHYGAVNYTTLAVTAAGGADEQTWRSFSVPAAALVTGANTLAVQVHQAALNSSDTGFDLRLSGVVQAETAWAQWQAIQFGTEAANDAIAGDFADPDVDGRVNLLEYAFGTRPDNYFAASFPSVSTEAERMVFRFDRNALATDLTYTVQTAAAPEGPWTAVAESRGGNPVISLVNGVTVSEPATGPLRQVEVRGAVDLSDFAPPRRFLRLAVTR